MGALQKYVDSIKRLYGVQNFDDLLNDANKVGLATQDILYLLQHEASGSDFTSKLEGLNSEDILPFKWVLDILKIKLNNTNTTDCQFFYNVIAALGVMGIWEIISKKYPNSENINKALEGKEISKFLPFNICLTDKKKKYFDIIGLDKLQDIDVNTENLQLMPKEYDKLILFYQFLEEDVLSEDEKERQRIIKEYTDELWNESLPIYKELYLNAIEQGCSGILVDKGLSVYSKTTNKVEIKSAIWQEKLFQSFQSCLSSECGFNFKITNDFENLKFKDLKEFNYLAAFHTYNAFGVINKNETTTKWVKFEPALKYRFYILTKAILNCFDLNKIGDFYSEIKAVLTNCIVVEKYDRTVNIQLTYKLDGVNTQYNNYFIKNNKEITSRESCKVLKNLQSQNNVVTLFGVFDAKKFAMEPLFSYQAYDKFVANGGRVGLDKVIIGRNLDGSNIEFSLKSNDTRVTAILAGSGSGKGVMTLGILTAIVANKVPFIYLDYKPDMAEMLWNIESIMNNNGITRSDGKPARILAIDAKLDSTGCAPIRGHLFGENLPSYLSNIPNTVFGVLPYLKLLQLYYILGSIRANEANKPEFGGAMTFAILDEFQANIKDNLSKLITTLDREMKSAKKSKDETSEDVEKYVTRLKALISRLANETGTFINTDGRKSQCRAVYLGQNADYSVWRSDNVEEVQALSSEWYGKTSYRFFGRNGGTGSYAPANAGSIAEFVNNKDTFGYWTYAVGAGKVNDVKDWPVFKAYSVLNENDYNIDNPDVSGRCTSGVLNNIPDASIKDYVKNEIFVINENGNRLVRPEVGFLGLVKKLSGLSDVEIADSLSEGYEVIWKVMCKYGFNYIYPDIESYLFDASLESLYTTDEIKRGVAQIPSEGDSASEKPIFENGSFFPESVDSSDGMSEDEKRELYRQNLENEKKALEDVKKEENRKKIIDEVNKLKSAYGSKISSAGKSLYTYKKDEHLFNDAKQSVLDTRNIYEQGFNDVVNKIDNEDKDFRDETLRNIDEFLDSRFNSIETLTFENIQKERISDKPETFIPVNDDNNSFESKPVPMRSTFEPNTKQDEKPIQKSTNEMGNFQNKVESKIETGDLKFNVNKLDEMGNVKASIQLTQQVIKDIKYQFGGINNIENICVTANGCLAINGYTYTPSFSEIFMNSLGLSVKNDVLRGKIGKVVILGRVVHKIMGNAIELTIEAPNVAYDAIFESEMGVLKGYDKLFKKYDNLSIVNLPDNELTRTNPKGKPISSGLGLGGKLANLFGFGKSKGSKNEQKSLPSPAATFNNGLVDKFFDSTPVRVLTGAFGWTMGCKAVVLAATIFGPWGLLFGALAMAGTYNEVKNNKGSNNRQRGASNNQTRTIQKTNSNKPRKSDNSDNDEY